MSQQDRSHAGLFIHSSNHKAAGEPRSAQRSGLTAFLSWGSGVHPVQTPPPPSTSSLLRWHSALVSSQFLQRGRASCHRGLDGELQVLTSGAPWMCTTPGLCFEVSPQSCSVGYSNANRSCMDLGALPRPSFSLLTRGNPTGGDGDFPCLHYRILRGGISQNSQPATSSSFKKKIKKCTHINNLSVGAKTQRLTPWF